MRVSVASIALVSALLVSACDRGSRDASVVNEAKVANEAKPAAPAALPTDAQGLVSELGIVDLFEMESSRLALQRSTSPGVNEMGQMLQREHTQSSARLKAAAAQAGLKLPSALDAERQKMLDELKSAQGLAFDQKFLGQQRAVHVRTLMIVQNYRSSGDNEALKQLAAALQPRIEFHGDRLNATLK